MGLCGGGNPMTRPTREQLLETATILEDVWLSLPNRVVAEAVAAWLRELAKMEWPSAEEAECLEIEMQDRAAEIDDPDLDALRELYLTGAALLRKLAG